jgi:hypothetical protein
MKKGYLFPFYLTLVILNSCENVIPVSNYDKYPSIQYQENPFEIEGINHNILLDSMINYFKSDYNIDQLSPTFTDSSYFDTLMVNYAVRGLNESNINPTINFQSYWNNYYDTNMINYIEDIELSVQHFLYDHNFSSSLDSIYCYRIFNLLKSVFSDSQNNSCNLNIFFENLKDSILSIENDMLNETWGVTDTIAFKRLAYIKYSTNFWDEYRFNHDDFISSTQIIKDHFGKGKIQEITEFEELVIGIITIWTDHCLGPVWSTIILIHAWCYFQQDELTREPILGDWWLTKW